MSPSRMYAVSLCKVQQAGTKIKGPVSMCTRQGLPVQGPVSICVILLSGFFDALSSYSYVLSTSVSM